MTQSRIEYLAKLRLLLSIDRIGPARLLSLVQFFGSPDGIFNSSFSALQQVNQINPTLANCIIDSHSNLSLYINKIVSEFEQLEKLNGRMITYFDDDYPFLLKKIYSPPIIIYVSGSMEAFPEPTIAIVGTRQPSNYGKEQAKMFAENLASQGVIIVSGMARGIDSIAHRSALLKKQKTYAVIGSGLNVIYPPENRNLFEEITANGAVITEYEFGTKPDAQNFPRRNRIISGLSLGTLIIESGINGGAVQTAAHALDQNREVFAVPGNINSKKSEGTNILIKKSEAKLVTCVEDILEELNLNSKPVVSAKNVRKTMDLNIFEQNLLEKLSNEPKQIDVISDECNLSTSDALVYLLSLELKGLIVQLPGKQFKLV